MKTSLSILVAVLLLIGSCAIPHRENADWPVYGGNKAGNRYSSLSQINLKNVQDLQVAWIYNSADASVSGGGFSRPSKRVSQAAWRSLRSAVSISIRALFRSFWPARSEICRFVAVAS